AAAPHEAAVLPAAALALAAAVSAHVSLVHHVRLSLRARLDGRLVGVLVGSGLRALGDLVTGRLGHDALGSLFTLHYLRRLLATRGRLGERPRRRVGRGEEVD